MYYVLRAYRDMSADIEDVYTGTVRTVTKYALEKIAKKETVIGIVTDVDDNSIIDYQTYKKYEFPSFDEAEEFCLDACSGQMIITQYRGEIFGFVKTSEFYNIFYVVLTRGKFGTLYLSYNGGYTNYLEDAKQFNNSKEAKIKAINMTKNSKTNKTWIVSRYTFR